MDDWLPYNTDNFSDNCCHDTDAVDLVQWFEVT
jgi:hypothetical protein